MAGAVLARNAAFLGTAAVQCRPAGTDNLVFYDGTNWIAADTGAAAAA